MTDDPNKKQPSQSDQQQYKNPADGPEKRPTQGGHDVETDEEEQQEQGGQRRAS